jgi:AmmeMemoRadiSam system protein B
MKFKSLEALRNQLSSVSHEEFPPIKIVFVPDHQSTDENQLFTLYSGLSGYKYDTVVFLETNIKATDKKIPMATYSQFECEFGPVLVNDMMRNEFCDEDDDFFIDDHAVGPEMELYKHLPYLVAALDEFKLVSVQVCDEDPSIVREVAYVLSEIMAGRNALLVVACSFPGDNYGIEDIKKLLDSADQSNVMNLLNSGDYRVSGSAAFQSGVFVGYNWGVSFIFLTSTTPNSSAIAGYGVQGAN